MAQENENKLLTRVPPQNKEAEIAVLCCCLDEPDTLAHITSFLQPEDFYVPAHQIIYETIFLLYAESKSIDVITVGDQLKKQGTLEKIGGMTYLSSIVDAHALVSNYMEYVKIVRQKALFRKLIKSMDEVTRLSYAGEEDAYSLIEIAISRLAELRERNKDDENFQILREVLSQTLTDIFDPKPDTSIKSHFPTLDYVTNGFRPGTLTIVAARPAMGKSAFVINIAANVAIKDKIPVAFFSLEMSAKEIGNRIISSRCDISTSMVQNVKKLTSEHIDKIKSTLPAFRETPLYIDDHAGLNTAEMLTRCRELQNKTGGRLGLVCIDYLQLMQPVSTRGNSSRQQEISDISRSLKLMAKELNVPVIALSQLSRDAEKRDDHRPVLSDLRDSGAIEQDADMVMFIHRPDYYKQKNNDDDEGDEKKFKRRSEDEEEIQKAEIIVAKNRQGPTKVVYVSWNGSRTTFFEKPKKNPNDIQGPSDEDAPPPSNADDHVFDTIFNADAFEEFDAANIPAPADAPAFEEFDASGIPDPGDDTSSGFAEPDELPEEFLTDDPDDFLGADPI